MHPRVARAGGGSSMKGSEGSRHGHSEHLMETQERTGRPGGRALPLPLQRRRCGEREGDLPAPVGHGRPPEADLRGRCAPERRAVHHRPGGQPGRRGRRRAPLGPHPRRHDGHRTHHTAFHRQQRTGSAGLHRRRCDRRPLRPCGPHGAAGVGHGHGRQRCAWGHPPGPHGHPWGLRRGEVPAERPRRDQLGGHAPRRRPDGPGAAGPAAGRDGQTTTASASWNAPSASTRPTGESPTRKSSCRA